MFGVALLRGHCIPGKKFFISARKTVYDDEADLLDNGENTLFNKQKISSTEYNEWVYKAFNHSTSMQELTELFPEARVKDERFVRKLNILHTAYFDFHVKALSFVPVNPSQEQTFFIRRDRTLISNPMHIVDQISHNFILPYPEYRGEPRSCALTLQYVIRSRRDIPATLPTCNPFTREILFEILSEFLKDNETQRIAITYVSNACREQTRVWGKECTDSRPSLPH